MRGSPSLVDGGRQLADAQNGRSLGA